jgi:hypothetical protein
VILKGLKGGSPRAAAGLLALVVLAGCGHGGTTGGAAHGGTAIAHPSLTIATYAPLTIDGRHFPPGEMVILRAQPREAGLKPVYARGHVRTDGTFTVRLRGYGLDRCTGFTVTATGPGGSHAILTSPGYGCPPVPAPGGSSPATSLNG